MTEALDQVLRALARETGRDLGELGVRPGDEKWIRLHAETVASLAGGLRRRTRWSALRRAFRRRSGQAGFGLDHK